MTNEPTEGPERRKLSPAQQAVVDAGFEIDYETALREAGQTSLYFIPGLRPRRDSPPGEPSAEPGEEGRS